MVILVAMILSYPGNQQGNWDKYLKGESMPIKMWKHNCLDSGSEHWTGSPKNCSCGGTFEFDGWHHTSSEAKAWYQKKYGFKIMGPHRSYLHEVFSGTDRRCSDCGGTGYHDIENGKDYEVCAACEGSGWIWLISAERIQELREMVLQKYPDAGAPYDIPNPSDSVVLHDLANDEMLVIKKEKKQ